MLKRLSLKQRILVACTLFGMFFGAGNLIFPVHLGQISGSQAILAIIGFSVTAVSIPILGVAAIGNTHSDGLFTLSNRVGKGYGYFFTCLLYLTIGPLFAIPRCATTSFTTGIEPMIAEGTPSWLVLLIFSFIFFALVLFFSLRPNQITVWIGKIINPVFLVFLVLLIVVALAKPGASISEIAPTADYEGGKALFSSIIEGYGTMDAIAGLAFGIVVIDIIRGMGVQDDDAIAKDVMSSGWMTGLLMIAIYAATILIGAQSRGLFETSDNGGIALTQIANHYLGSFGSIVLAITITFACLKTSIGLVTSCADTFSRMFPKAFSYTVWAIIFSVFSFGISNFGLSKIIEFSIPVLMFIYPLAITLIILALCEKFFNRSKIVYVSVTTFTVVAAFFDLFKTLPEGIQNALHLDIPISFAEKYLPLYNLNLGWVVPAAIGAVVGIVIYAATKNKVKAA